MESTSRSAAETLQAANDMKVFGSGSKRIDELLQGGYKAGSVTEVFGRSGSGKTQLAAQAVLLAAKKGLRSLFIDSEGSFRPERLEQMAAARGWATAGVLERITYVRSDSSPEQMEMVRGMNRRKVTAECRIVVVDTLTRNFSVELPGNANLSSRQAALDIHLSEIARDAYLSGRAYILTNRVTFGPEGDVGIGGRTVEQLVHASIRLEKEADGVRATLLPAGKSSVVSVGAAGLE